jgi:integrase
VPLAELVASKLADYILDERPASTETHMFLRCKAPHLRLSGHASIYRVTAQVFRQAGVSEVKAGCRLLRHNAASKLLAAAVPLPTISAVLGHASAESTNLYMSVDRDRLLDCVLDVPEGARP